MEDEILGKNEALMSSSAWNQDFKTDLERFPLFRQFKEGREMIAEVEIELDFLRFASDILFLIASPVPSLPSQEPLCDRDGNFGGPHLRLTQVLGR